jgi:heat-inducible transcriptional repressor
VEQRKREILKAVVKEFTTSALPVGSQVLASRYFVNLSSATIRNELADLADLGYVVQPHTSAGRVPTDLGYRYFVDFLMTSEPIPAQVRAYVESAVGSAPTDVQGLVDRVAMTLAAVTDNASIVTTPQGSRARIKHLDLVSLEPSELLLILLLEGNVLRQQVLSLAEPATQSKLSSLAARTNRDLRGRDRDAVSTRLQAVTGLEAEVLSQVAAVLEQYERGAETLVVHDGLRNLLKQPEFSDASRLQQVVEVLEETRYLAEVLRTLIGESDLQVVIGSEHSTRQLRSCTVVLTTYGPSQQLKGVLGVVGPTRMRYGQIIGRLRVVARAAGERLAQLSA